MLTTVLFWLSLGLLIWVYAGYPICVAAIAKLAPLHLDKSGRPLSLTVAIAVHDEGDQIRDRLTDTFRQRLDEGQMIEVLVGNDGSTDNTDSIVRELAVGEPRLRLLSMPRAGQTATQHALFETAQGEVVVLTDAETRFEPGCLSALADVFRDPRVWCATGRLEWRDEHVTATAANEGLYWRYERRIRDYESKAGLLTAVTGALLAVRRSAYRGVPASASMDHLLPLYVREDGGLVVYVAEAVATDRPISGLREQFRNRSRTALRGIRANLSMIVRLAPWRRPEAALAIWSHKLLRWATPWLLLAGLMGGVAEIASGSWLAALFVAALLVAGASAAVAQLMASSGRRPPRPIAVTRAFAIVNLAFARAWIDVIRGHRIEAWHRAEWEAPG